MVNTCVIFDGGQPVRVDRPDVEHQPGTDGAPLASNREEESRIAQGAPEAAPEPDSGD
mgnify:CR=1 FL=1